MRHQQSLVAITGSVATNERYASVSGPRCYPVVMTAKEPQRNQQRQRPRRNSLSCMRRSDPTCVDDYMDDVDDTSHMADVDDDGGGGPSFVLSSSRAWTQLDPTWRLKQTYDSYRGAERTGGPTSVDDFMDENDGTCEGEEEEPSRWAFEFNKRKPGADPPVQPQRIWQTDTLPRFSVHDKFSNEISCSTLCTEDNTTSDASSDMIIPNDVENENHGTNLCRQKKTVQWANDVVYIDEGVRKTRTIKNIDQTDDRCRRSRTIVPPDWNEQRRRLSPGIPRSPASRPGIVRTRSRSLDTGIKESQMKEQQKTKRSRNGKSRKRHHPIQVELVRLQI